MLLRVGAITVFAAHRQPASDIYEDEGILMISPGATNPELTQRGYQYIPDAACE